MTTRPSSLNADERAELERLRRRVAELDAELAEQARRINLIVGATQQRIYWLDRWHIDLNAIMARPGASEVRALARAVRGPIRVLRRLKRRMSAR